MIGCSLDGIRTNIMCFADDICLLSPSAMGLQQLLSILHARLTAVRLTINSDKCAQIIFKTKNI